MPAYPWLERNAADDGTIQKRLRALRALGHPYSDEEIAAAPAALEGRTEMDALIAYLQTLGTAIKGAALTMDPGLLQAIWTLVALTAFLAVVAWAWSARAKRGFEEAARLPLDEDR